MTIVLDAMGSDDHPLPELQAAVSAAELFNEEIILVGNQEILSDKLKALNPKNLPVTIQHAPDVVEMADKVVESARKKPQNSMAVGLELVKSKQAYAFVTAGNTGAAMFNGLRTLGRIQGISRPALPALFPVKTGSCVVLDIGANVDCRPEFLLQFAIMGAIYAEKLLNVPNPKIGLLANGEEPGKGNQLIKDTFPVFEKSGLNFIGNVEPKELFAGHAEVVVTDGFIGNIFLKTSEAVAKFLTDMIRQELTANPIAAIGGLLAKSAFAKIKAKMDPGEVGGAPLLGIDGLVIVGHGRSDAKALTNAIRVARQAQQVNLQEALRDAIQQRLAQIEGDRN